MWENFFLGLLQGLTEFLPVSSSGHLFLLARFFKTPQETFFLVLTVHGATLLSIVTVFRKDLKSLFVLKDSSLLLKVVVALAPLFFTGLFFKSFVAKSFQEGFVSIGFLATGVFLLSLLFKRQASNEPLTFLRAFLIGMIQAFCVLPGFSRSGWTIGAGILLGLSPQRAAFFSFLIALPAIAGALLVEGLTQTFSGSGAEVVSLSGGLILAFCTAYISGIFALLVVLKLLHQKKFYLFGLYLIPLGLYLAFF